MTTRTLPLRVFLSYASEDDAHRIELLKFTKPMIEGGLLEMWHDRQLFAGDRYDDVIAEQLEEADLFVLLVSQDFLASDYIGQRELARALEREADGSARVIPILLDHCTWTGSPLAALHVLPDRARPVVDWDNPRQAWVTVADGLRAVAEELAASPPHSGLAAEGRTASQVASPARVTTPGVEIDPSRYLEWLREEHTWLDVRGMGAQVSEKMELRHVYTELAVSGGARERQAGAKAHDARGDVPGAVEGLGDGAHAGIDEALAEHEHAVLLGDPGSGKTTLLRFVAQNLARARLGDPDALARIGLDAEAEGLEAPFPIFVRLERLASFLRDHPRPDLPDIAPEHFYRYLDHLVAGHGHGLPAGYLSGRAKAGGCFLLLDGLDEVPGSDTRATMVELVGQVIRQGRTRNRHLVTCRTRAYEDLTQFRDDVTTLTLAPFRRPQVERFVENWSRALHRVPPVESDTPRADTAREYGADLLRAIDDNPSSASFSESPLMLTVLAVVYWSERKLPEQRAELYEAAVRYLLESRRDLADHSTGVRKEALQAIAIAMFEDPDGVQRSVGREDAARAARPCLGLDRDAALAFLENEELHSGIVVSRSAGEVEFWHLTFQEYLAAHELAQDEEGWARLEQRLHDDRWSEVVLLYAGCRLRFGGQRAARRIVEHVLATGSDRVSRARAVALTARILRDLTPYGGDPAAGTRYEEMLRDTLGIFEPGGEVVAESVRVEVGDALGAAGDPRLADPEGKWVTVPGGTLLMGAQKADRSAPGFDDLAYDDESPVHEVRVPEFRIGRFPVTVQEFRAFVDAGGYRDRAHWGSDGWSWRRQAGVSGPGDWDEQAANPNRPVTRVSWYEADAYCRWAGKRLPSEAEWEWAARGAEGRRWPWGPEEPTPEHANLSHNVGHPTPVGIYPLGGTPDLGIRDLAGNVWEWCGDAWHDDYEGAPTDGSARKEERSGAARVLRGGSFGSRARLVRCAVRDRYRPDVRYRLVGFRVASSPSSSDLRSL